MAFVAFEDDFRCAGYQSSALDTRGTFDPITGVICHDRAISDLLAVPTGEPLVVVGKAGSEMNRAFATALHENIHWWQHIGSTSGFVYGLSLPTQATQLAFYLSQLCAEGAQGIPVAKPLVRHVSNDLPFDHPAWLASCRWTETEFGAAYLFDPRDLVSKIQASQKLGRFFVSSGHALLCFYTNTISSLSSVFDPGMTGLPSIDGLIGRCNDFMDGEKAGFVAGTFTDIPLGLRHLCEAQARLSEMQLQCLIYESWDWQQFAQGGYLAEMYGQAFAHYLELTRFPAPTSPLDATVNLFLLLCDIALNPAEGYPCPVTEDGEFLYRTHPGSRFLSLCSAVTKHLEVVGLVEQPTFENYRLASELLCAEVNWPTPAQVAAEVTTAFERMSDFESLENHLYGGNYGTSEVPTRFLCAQHYSLMESKAQVPAFFCWPAWFLATKDETELETNGVGELYSLHQAPFLASSLTSGVDTVQIDGMSQQLKAQLTNVYFGTHALYDLIRQWMYFRTPFQIKYNWKLELTPEEIQHVRRTFTTNFGIDLSEIPCQ